MRLSFITPAAVGPVAGGGAYMRRLVAALGKRGHLAELIELRHVPPVPDPAGAAAAWNRLAPDTLPVIDGAALLDFEPMRDALTARGAVGLLHRPTALESGSDGAQRERSRAAERHLLPALERVIASNAATADRLCADFGVARERVRVVVPGSDPAPRSAGSGGPECRILSVGALVARKGHDTLLRALARLFDLEWRLTVAGSAERDPVHARTLSALAEELGIAGRVRFAGEVDADALEALWREADLFALATHWEGYGMAVAEALRRGLPVAVTAGGAATELIPIEAGVVCAPGDHASLSKAMRRLVFSPDLRRAMAEVAWEAGRALPSWDTQAAAFVAALRD